MREVRDKATPRFEQEARSTPPLVVLRLPDVARDPSPPACKAGPRKPLPSCRTAIKLKAPYIFERDMVSNKHASTSSLCSFVLCVLWCLVNCRGSALLDCCWVCKAFSVPVFFNAPGAAGHESNVEIVKRNTRELYTVSVPHIHRPVLRASMAHGNEGGGEKFGPRAAADDDAAVASNIVGGGDHEPHNGTLVVPSTGKARERDTNGNADDGKALKIGIYGLVNAMMAIPILYGYAAIIFRCVGVDWLEILGFQTCPG